MDLTTGKDPACKDLTFDEYQERTAETAIYPAAQGLEYTALGLASEAGEVAGKVKKIIRDHNGKPPKSMLFDIAAELGDVLWYVARLADEIDCGATLGGIAEGNLRKLELRKRRGVLGGSGDNR